MPAPVIDDVSDTALWVATYRAVETERPDALFHDPLAGKLAGEKGRTIAKRMHGTRYTSWSVVIRTCIIDDYIHELVSEKGIDTVLNLGAGLDTRPYRMELPASLRWIEVDFPHMIELKEERLRAEKPRCKLERIRLDLSNEVERARFFAEISSQSKNILVLTEGVVPYLSNEQAASFASALSRSPSFRFWILDYFAPEVMRFIRSPRRMRQMKNAPFQFVPKDWFGFFAQAGWKTHEMRYLAAESLKRGRMPPFPWWVRILRIFAPAGKLEAMKKLTGYVVMKPNGSKD